MFGNLPDDEKFFGRKESLVNNLKISAIQMSPEVWFVHNDHHDIYFT